MRATYRVPSGRHRVEEVIQRSRFITTLGRARDVEEAREFVRTVKEEFPDASHNCWAYVAGPPGDTAFIGMSDEGEPHGTAGRPMLTVLLHAEVGEVVAVVTRFFGGVKLGKGGLVRAYSSGVQLALQAVPTVARVERVRVRIVLEYAVADAVRRLLEGPGIVMRGEEYGAQVCFEAGVPAEALEGLEREVAGATRGQGAFEAVGPEEDDG